MKALMYNIRQMTDDMKQLIEARKDIEHMRGDIDGLKTDVKELRKEIADAPDKVVMALQRTFDERYASKKGYATRLHIAYTSAVIGLLLAAIALYEAFRN